MVARLHCYPRIHGKSRHQRAVGGPNSLRLFTIHCLVTVQELELRPDRLSSRDSAFLTSSRLGRPPSLALYTLSHVAHLPSTSSFFLCRPPLFISSPTSQTHAMGNLPTAAISTRGLRQLLP
ncbi:hypothetical protein FRC18_006849 [Serendipita sp. 400]|nr:hypothetical protein FRC18_006849 [Serendipita sp. 400]